MTITKEATGFRIIVDAEGLTPGKHGFHIHELDDISAPDATSAGGLFNPEGKKYGAPDNFERHVGDLGNVEADEDGKAHYERIHVYPPFVGFQNILGRAEIVHANEDEFTTEPICNPGLRVACGVIGIAGVYQEKW